jgi:hypothetical protein
VTQDVGVMPIVNMVNPTLPVNANVMLVMLEILTQAAKALKILIQAAQP